jgi:hypothetical protein
MTYLISKRPTGITITFLRGREAKSWKATIWLFRQMRNWVKGDIVDGIIPDHKVLDKSNR